MELALTDGRGQLQRVDDARGRRLEDYVVEDILFGLVGESHLRGRGWGEVCMCVLLVRVT